MSHGASGQPPDTLHLGGETGLTRRTSDMGRPIVLGSVLNGSSGHLHGSQPDWAAWARGSKNEQEGEAVAWPDLSAP